MPRGFPLCTSEFNKLETKYRTLIDQIAIKTNEQCTNFFSYVFPSLSSPTRAENKWRFPCNFPTCCGKEPAPARQDKIRSYCSKQKLIQHLLLHHADQLPGGGSFLAPNDNCVAQGGFSCSKCASTFARKDHFDYHMKNSKCAEENVSLYDYADADDASISKAFCNRNDDGDESIKKTTIQITKKIPTIVSEVLPSTSHSANCSSFVENDTCETCMFINNLFYFANSNFFPNC